MKHQNEHRASHASLSEWQKKAVEAIDGKVLILAGAGSGKTTVLTNRIAYLIDKGVPPESIIGLTFTNKAGHEMASRLARFVGRTVSEKVSLSTFHSFAYHLLRKEGDVVGLRKHFTIADRRDVLRHVQMIARDLLDRPESEMPSLYCLLDDIAMAKNNCVPVREVAKKRDGGGWYGRFAETVFQRLNDCFRIYNMVDFDHMLWLTYELFSQNDAIRKRYSDRFQYVMIDEYQDTSPLQDQIASQLAATWGNICVVGDDDQSIYSWRGADVSRILKFPADIVVKLEQNFRSTPTILNAANSVIKMNSERYEKSLWSLKDPGKLIDVFVAPSEEAEAEGVVGRIAAMKEKYGLNWKDFAVLYRSNSLSTPIEAQLLRAKYLEHGVLRQSIPYRVYGGDEFYDHKEVQDILAYLKVAINPADNSAVIRSLSYPRRGVGEASLEYLQEVADKDGGTMFDAIAKATLSQKDQRLHQKACRGLQEYQETLRAFRELLRESTDIGRSVRWLVEAIRMKEALVADCGSQTVRTWKEEHIDRFLETIAAFQAEKSHGESDSFDLLHQCVASFHMQQDQRILSSKKGEEDHVSLMTFHSAKGLEFSVCFLIGIEDHLIPHEKSLVDRGLEEERRLMYVALTRAKERLFMSMTTKRKKIGRDGLSKPSRFLLDIPRECLRPVDVRAFSLA